MEIGDDQCVPALAESVAHQLAAAKVALVAGHFCSSSSIPASRIYAEANIIQITPASTNPRLTDEAAQKGWSNVFRTSGRDDTQAVLAGNWLVSWHRDKRIAIIHDRSTYGRGLADTVKKIINAAGIREVVNESIAQGERNFQALVANMRSVGVDLVYFGGYHTEGANLIRQARERGLHAGLVAGDALVDTEFWKIAGAAGQGTLMTFAPDPRRLPSAQTTVDRFRTQGIDPRDTRSTPMLPFKYGRRRLLDLNHWMREGSR